MAKKSKKKKKNRKKKSGAISCKNSVTAAIVKESSEITALSTNADDQFERIYKILAVEISEYEDDDDDKAAVSYENLEKYLKYLKKEIHLPVIVTGIEDMGCFRWEEYYNFGQGNKAEYENLKKKYPSFRDKYLLLSIIEEFDEDEGLYAEVQRISDKKKFTLTLADLETVEKKTKNSILLEDYAVWQTNFR